MQYANAQSLKKGAITDPCKQGKAESGGYESRRTRELEELHRLYSTSGYNNLTSGVDDFSLILKNNFNACGNEAGVLGGEYDLCSLVLLSGR